MELRNINEDKNIIESIEVDSIADELGIEIGDVLLSINDANIKDIIDYKYLIADEYILLAIEKPDGEIWEFEIEKDYDEDLGLVFRNSLIDKAKSCRNNCIFCFIDQLPKNMRDTLYFKDDDSRLSFLQGNFITLTNMSDEEIQRIIDYRLTPINVSVHTTNPELRVKMLNNKNAGKVYEILKRFHEANLEINCQIVAVPGVNDGEELNRTIDDLAKLSSSIKSIAIVPIGLTKFRQGLYQVEKFNEETSKALIDLVKGKQKIFLKELGTRFVFASDEFYASIKMDLPKYEEYEGFPQLENGVGLIRSFEDEILKELNKIKSPIESNKKFLLATGSLAFDFISTMADKIKAKFIGLNIKVVPIINNYFGDTITVSGLTTGIDLINQLKEFEDYHQVIIPRSMMKADEEIFLDNISLIDLEKKLEKNVLVSKVEGKTFIDIIKNRGINNE